MKEVDSIDGYGYDEGKGTIFLAKGKRLKE
jgi:hypothetical protein